MKREDVERMAQKAGMELDDGCGIPLWLARGADLERFAALVAAHEREVCAKVAETHQYVAGWGVAAAIRAREDKR